MWRFPSTARCTVRDCCKGKNHHRTFDNTVHKLSPFFLPSSREHFKAKTVSVNLSAPPAAVWGQIHWFPVSQWTDILPGRERRLLSFFYFFECFVWLQHGSSVIVHCSRVDSDLMSESHDNAFSIQCFLKDNVTSYTLPRHFFLVFKKLCCHYPSPSTRMHVCVCMYVVWMSKCT